MKVGIITLQGLNNYGNRLQNYALQRFLEKEYDSEVVSLISKHENIPENKIKNARKLNFKKFNNRNINIQTFKSSKELIEIGKNLDLVVIGSDQIWCPYVNKNSKYVFAKFIDKEKRMSYAPSFGGSSLPFFKRRTFVKGINEINFLSVREKSGQKIVKTLTNRDAEVVIDPTMLLNKDEWSSFAQFNNSNGKRKYLVTYFLGKTKKHENKILEISKKYNYEIIRLNDKQYKDLYAVDPQTFLGYIKNADFVCTDSFHGAVFSILFEKPFVVFDRDDLFHSNQGTRLKTLLKTFNLEDRYVKTLTNDLLKIDFSLVGEKLEDERRKSIKFLDKALR